MRWVLTKWLQPSALLTAGAAVWRALHWPSFHILRCVKAAVPLQMGYAQLAHASARGTLPPGEPAGQLQDASDHTVMGLTCACVVLSGQCLRLGHCSSKSPAPVGEERSCLQSPTSPAPGPSATGGSCAGPEQDERWRAQHRRAARAVAHLMVDVYTEPPLGGLLPVLDTSSFTVASPLASSSLLAFSPGSTCLRGSFTAGGRLREAPPPQVRWPALLDAWRMQLAFSISYLPWPGWALAVVACVLYGWWTACNRGRHVLWDRALFMPCSLRSRHWKVLSHVFAPALLPRLANSKPCAPALCMPLRHLTKH